jgi:hypothetical protein
MRSHRNNLPASSEDCRLQIADCRLRRQRTAFFCFLLVILQSAICNLQSAICNSLDGAPPDPAWVMVRYRDPTNLLAAFNLIEGERILT